jgi:UDP-glucose 4-epimerase
MPLPMPRAESVAGAAVLVTGGCGFIGSHLVRQLLARGARRVVVLDSLRYGAVANLGESAARVELIPFALGTDPAAALARPLTGIDYLFHLAAEKHNQSRDDPTAVLRSNVEGTHAIFAAAAAAGVRKTVFTSSLYAYGRLAGPPFREDEPARPTTIYGISKLCGEHLLRHFDTTAGLRGNALRYLFVYGPQQFAGTGYKSLIVASCERTLAGEPPVVYGDGRQALDYVYVDDVVQATISALEAPVSGEVINVGSGRGTTVEEVIDTLVRVSGRALGKIHAPPDWTAGTCRVGDVSKAQQLLGWTPHTPLAEGLARTFDWIARRRAP